MEKFRNEANVTQARYGYKRNDAVFEILLKVIIVNNIAIHKPMISINAQPGLLNPKKMRDQKKFKIS